jgi:GAF domain-containing protein
MPLSDHADQRGVAQVVGSRGYVERNLEHILRAENQVVGDTAHLAYMYDRRQPLIIPDVHSDIVQGQYTPSPVWFWHSYAGVPICLKDEVLGFINLGSNTPYFFTPVHADRLEAFAEQAAIAIQNARLHEQARTLAAHQERQRLARELHDAVSQPFFSFHHGGGAGPPMETPSRAGGASTRLSAPADARRAGRNPRGSARAAPNGPV